MADTDPVAELACVPAAIPAEERAGHFALARRLFTELARESTALSNGYAFRFDAGAFDAVARFVANERKCCPFMDFEITITSGDGPLWLRMTGPVGTREVLQAEFGLTGSCAC